MEVATSYIKHELRKLLWRVEKEQWEAIDRDVADWVKEPQAAGLNFPRDFWNLFHGMCMGYKLKIGLIYFVTARNVKWSRKTMAISKLWFGIDYPQTRVVGEGKLPAERVSKYYLDPEHAAEREEWWGEIKGKSGGSADRDEEPIIVVQKMHEREMVYSVYDGNRRLAKAILEGREAVDVYLGEFVEGSTPKDGWIATTILMENLLFARQAYERGDEGLFSNYMGVLQDMVSQSQSARYELKARALIGPQTFMAEVLRRLGYSE